MSRHSVIPVTILVRYDMGSFRLSILVGHEHPLAALTHNLSFGLLIDRSENNLILDSRNRIKMSNRHHTIRRGSVLNHHMSDGIAHDKPTQGAWARFATVARVVGSAVVTLVLAVPYREVAAVKPTLFTLCTPVPAARVGPVVPLNTSAAYTKPPNGMTGLARAIVLTPVVPHAVDWSAVVAIKVPPWYRPAKHWLAVKVPPPVVTPTTMLLISRGLTFSATT